MVAARARAPGLHCCYCLAAEGTWLVAAWTDTVGEVLVLEARPIRHDTSSCGGSPKAKRVRVKEEADAAVGEEEGRKARVQGIKEAVQAARLKTAAAAAAGAVKAEAAEAVGKADPMDVDERSGAGAGAGAGDGAGAGNENGNMAGGLYPSTTPESLRRALEWLVRRCEQLGGQLAEAAGDDTLDDEVGEECGGGGGEKKKRPLGLFDRDPDEPTVAYRHVTIARLG